MAKWADETIKYTNAKPDIHGNYSFRVLIRDFNYMAGRNADRYFRQVFKEFGYAMRKYGQEYLITKLANH